MYEANLIFLCPVVNIISPGVQYRLYRPLVAVDCKHVRTINHWVDSKRVRVRCLQKHLGFLLKIKNAGGRLILTTMTSCFMRHDYQQLPFIASPVKAKLASSLNTHPNKPPVNKGINALRASLKTILVSSERFYWRIVNFPRSRNTIQPTSTIEWIVNQQRVVDVVPPGFFVFMDSLVMMRQKGKR